MPSAVETVTASLGWAVVYAVAFFTARHLAPLRFTHCSKLDEKDMSYWAASVNSVLNTIIVVPLAWQAGLHWSGVAYDKTSPLSTMACHAMLGYTLWDFLLIIYYRNEWSGLPMYLVHHMGVFGSWGVAAASGLGHCIVVPVLLLEATGPFVNARWFLSVAGLKNTTRYVVNGILMAISFFVLRIAFNWWLFIQRYFMQWEELRTMPLGVFITCALGFPLNLILQHLWFWKICKGIQAILFEKGQKPASSTPAKTKRAHKVS